MLIIEPMLSNSEKKASGIIKTQHSIKARFGKSSASCDIPNGVMNGSISSLDIFNRTREQLFKHCRADAIPTVIINGIEYCIEGHDALRTVYSYERREFRTNPNEIETNNSW